MQGEQGEEEGNLSFPFLKLHFWLLKDRRAELVFVEPPLTAGGWGETCASISSPVPRGHREPRGGDHGNGGERENNLIKGPWSQAHGGLAWWGFSALISVKLILFLKK